MSYDGSEQRLASHIRAEIPSFGGDLHQTFAEIGLDSFGLVALRARLEQGLGVTISDADWTRISRPTDILPLIEPRSAATTSHQSFGESRSYVLNMPQMALGGLSESWLFKEIGDVHWSMISRGLGVESSNIRSGEGHRLYATFTRFQLRSSRPLGTYEEGEKVNLSSSIVRYGGGMFFSETALIGRGRNISAQVMSSFSQRASEGANSALLKGQPDIPEGCPINAIPTLPSFGNEYRLRRQETPGPALFETTYEIMPYYDVNGVGLIYFAAYPIICDICTMRYAGLSFALAYSTEQRDVFYYANSDPNDKLVYRLHRWDSDENTLRYDASISRSSDGTMMAYISTIKAKHGQ